MRHLLFSTAVLLAAAPLVLADGATLKEARQRWLRGNYEEAHELYTELLADAKTKAAATVGLSRVLESRGEYDKAQELLDGAAKADPKNAAVGARRAELLYTRGRWDEALKAAEAVIAADADHLLARWVRAQVIRDKGDMKQADQECRWFVRYYTQRSNADKDITDPDELLIVAQAGLENARWHSLSDQFEFILKEVLEDALKADKDFWPAEYLAGAILLEKYNRGEALDAFDKALKINPDAAEVLVGKGVSALDKFEIKDAEQFAARALRVNPNLPEALRLKADVHLTGGDVAAALKELARARQVNPRDERTLGRIAACHLLQGDQKEYDAVVAEVEKHDAKPAPFYYELGAVLEGRRRFDLAEGYFKKAAQLRPMVAAAMNNLGLLYMRLGREEAAEKILDEAFEADPFNVRVSNTRKVLHHLAKYETLKTEHFTLRYDPDTDATLARYLGDFLEGVYAELAKKFQYQATGPILIEVFNNHEMFSGRVVALPDLHTIGACTGKMVAMVSTHGKGIRKPFNWARVMRHELVHIFNLEQTKYLCPHWLTEGLAVENEGFPRPQQWNDLLRERVPARKLMTLDDIDLGFIRPRSPLDWHMAYCQSQLYVQYLVKRFGAAAVGELLNAYRDGLGTAAAIQRVCKVDKDEFEKGYREYLDEVVRGLQGRPGQTPMTYQELKEAHEQKPDDLDLAARYAEQLLRRDKTQARKLVERILAKKPNHSLASYVKAKLLLQAGDADEARKVLEAGVDRKAPEPRLLQELGKLYYDANEFDKAAELFELGRQTEPYASEWLELLARVYAQAGNKEKQIAALTALVPMDADDFDSRKRLTRLLLEAGRFADAEKYARQCLEINIRDAEAQEFLFKALEEQKKNAEAARLRKLLDA